MLGKGGAVGGRRGVSRKASSTNFTDGLNLDTLVLPEKESEVEGEVEDQEDASKKGISFLFSRFLLICRE